MISENNRRKQCIFLPVPADFLHDSSDPDQTEFFGCRCEDRWGIVGKRRLGFPNVLPGLMNLRLFQKMALLKYAYFMLECKIQTISTKQYRFDLVKNSINIRY